MVLMQIPREPECLELAIIRLVPTLLPAVAVPLPDCPQEYMAVLPMLMVMAFTALELVQAGVVFMARVVMFLQEQA